jgi:hypothetical protein
MDNIGIYQISFKKKFFNKDDLLKFEENIIKEYEETKTLYKLTYNKKNYFEKNTFIKKNYKDFSVIFGVLKNKYIHLSGSGMFEFIKKKLNKVRKYFSPRLDDYNNTTKKYIQLYGDIPITEMYVYRTPLDSILNTAINALSFGQWNKLKAEYGFDKFYHLALVLRLQNNKNIIVEKLDVVSVSDSYKTNSKTENIKVDNYKGGLTLNTLLNNARTKLNNDKLFFGYDPLTNNCQYFIRYLLEYNDLYTPEINNFLFQDISQLVKKLNPITKKIMKGTTDLSATINKITGKGKKYLK